MCLCIYKHFKFDIQDYLAFLQKGKKLRDLFFIVSVVII